MPKVRKKTQEQVSLRPATRNYIYQPLNEAKKQVRILVLAPGSFFDEHELGRVTLYPKSGSLRGALQYLRHPKLANHLWIDQICINKYDTAERGSQVQLMRNIYAKATFVAAWLGTLTEEIKNNELEDLLEMMRYAAPILKSTLSDYEEKRRDGGLRLREKILLTKIVRLRSSDRSLEQVINTLYVRLETFFNEAWFKRIWTLQEAVLAFQLFLQVGWTHATWDDIFHIYSAPEFLEPDIGETLAFESTWLSMTSFRLRNGRHPTLPWTGAISRLHRVGSDDRDYVYGQLGLVNRRAMNLLKPDYSARVESVFISSTLVLIKADEILDTLGTCCAGSKTGKHLLPSWCRDWSDGGSGFGIRDDNQTSNQAGPFKAASKYHPQMVNQFHDRVMCVRGVVIDETGIKVLKRSMGRGSMDKEMTFDDAWLPVSMTFMLPGRLSIEDGRSRSFCRTPINNTFETRSRAEASSISQAISWLREAEDEMGFVDMSIPSAVKGGFSANGMIGQLRRVANRSRSLFETTGRRFGRSCEHVQPGDKICLLCGGRLPFILRKAGMVNLATDNDQSAKTQACQLIGGESYVEGPADGEGREGIAEGDPRVQDIRLA